MSLDGRLQYLIMMEIAITSDAITGNGSWTAAGNHDPNGSQNAIGAKFRTWHAKGWIEPTGRFVKSKAPHRKGGKIEVWQVTARGRAWATGSDRLL